MCAVKNILDYCFNGYELLKLDENHIFMCDKVLCKLAKTHYYIIKKTQNLEFKVVALENPQADEYGKPIAKLEIYDKNNLILTENLYSIISR